MIGDVALEADQAVIEIYKECTPTERGVLFGPENRWSIVEVPRK